MLKIYSTMNACLFICNYPLTLAYLLYFKEHWFYIITIALLMLNKIVISQYNSSVRAYLLSANHNLMITQFEECITKLQERRNQLNAKAYIDSKLAKKVGSHFASKIKKMMIQKQQAET